MFTKKLVWITNLYNTQNEMIVLLLAMLEGNETGSRIARRLANTLNDSKENVHVCMCVLFFSLTLMPFQETLKYLHSFVQLKDLTAHNAFIAYDTNQDGWISPTYALYCIASPSIVRNAPF